MAQHFSPFWLYFPAFGVVIVGLIIYFWHATRELIVFARLWGSAHYLTISAEEQGKSDPQMPDYVRPTQPEEGALV